MDSVGIDVSKRKEHDSSHAALREVVYSPFEVTHTSSELSALAKRLKSLDGETRVVMETTGNYHLPIAMALHEAGICVSAVYVIFFSAASINCAPKSSFILGLLYHKPRIKYRKICGF